MSNSKFWQLLLEFIMLCLRLVKWFEKENFAFKVVYCVVYTLCWEASTLLWGLMPWSRSILPCLLWKMLIVPFFFLDYGLIITSCVVLLSLWIKLKFSITMLLASGKFVYIKLNFMVTCVLCTSFVDLNLLSVFSFYLLVFIVSILNDAQSLSKQLKK